jgi:hypothetical protein
MTDNMILSKKKRRRKGMIEHLALSLSFPLRSVSVREAVEFLNDTKGTFSRGDGFWIEDPVGKKFARGLD